MNLLYPFTTMSFAYPLILLAPFLLWFLAVFKKPKQPALTYPELKILKAAPLSLKLRLRALILPPLLVCFVLFLCLAAARPQKVTALEQKLEARNIMLVIDVSPSMGAEDFLLGGRAVSRLKAVKAVVSEFIKARSGDLLGLVVFGGRAYLQAPLTFDHQLIQSLVERLEVGIAGDGTALGDGLGIALKRMKNLTAKSQAVILLTDGVSNAGQVNPLKAAKVARDLGVKVHTIGIGSDKPVVTQLPGGIFSSRLRAQAEYDEQTLKEVADLTGGVFFNASSLEGLNQVYASIDKLERAPGNDAPRIVAQELFVPYAALALGCYLLYVILANTVFRRIP